jgi:predicted enzyme related to lactoylglutathione lyase
MFSLDSLGHINVVVTDLEEATRFYQTLFGASVEQTFPHFKMWDSRGRPAFWTTPNPSM